jgi:hypothetical protein
MRNINRIPIAADVTTQEAINAIIISAKAIKTSARRLPRGPIKSYEDGRWSVEEASDNFVVLSYSIGQLLSVLDLRL